MSHLSRLSSLNQLHQHTSCRRWMNERDRSPIGARTGRLVDETHAFRSQVRQYRVEIFNLNRKVMQAGSATREKRGNRRVRIERFDDLDGAAAERDKSDAHAV